MRPRTERIAWGDELLLNFVGYSNGKLIPFSVRADVWVPLAPAPLLPGLYEQLVGHLPGETVLADILLSQDYPVEALRGQPARFAVQIQAAREVKFPDPASPEFLKAFGRGDTVEAATNSVLKELEQETVQLLRLQAQEMVLNEVAARTKVDIPEALVDEEVRRRWGSSEGRAVTELKFTEKQQEESLQTWLKDEPTRAVARQRLRISRRWAPSARATASPSPRPRCRRSSRPRPPPSGFRWSRPPPPCARSRTSSPASIRRHGT
ncbi:hypothetical protein ACN28S_64495 [Cystobacter fuscus]